MTAIDHCRRLDEDEKIANPRKDLHRFLPGMTFKRPMDMELGPDGCFILSSGEPNGGIITIPS